MTQSATSVFGLSDRITLLPVLHGSGECALFVRRWLLEHPYDCLAVPLPPSFQQAVEAGAMSLPRPGIVIQKTAWNSTSEWNEDDQEAPQNESEQIPSSYVPIDPCQPVIAAIRTAIGEHYAREFIDLETDPFIPVGRSMPDPYALKHVKPEVFSTALLAATPEPPDPFSAMRIQHMAARLHALEKRYENILCLCNVLHWPWLRDAYRSNAPEEEPASVDDAMLYRVDPRSLVFLFGELPLITGLYEHARMELEDDDNLSIDGVKHVLLKARDSYRKELRKRARKITPLLLAQCVKYIRNLSLIASRMTPDLYTMTIASQQIMGDQYARHVVEAACEYPYEGDPGLPLVTLGIDQCRFPDDEVCSLVSRLPGSPVIWRTLQLQPKPREEDTARWQARWDPYRQCSWPPEDERIELFRTRVSERASAIIGNDLARTEKFTTSVKDGIDIRDTLRHWYENQIYVKVNPPDRGPLDSCVMLFETPADPRNYPWRATWFAEHKHESTLAFYATDFHQEMIGPGIGLATYGGSMFLFPPVVIRDIWTDSRFDFSETLEDRLIAAACFYSRGPRVAMLSLAPPGQRWKRIAKRYKKQLVHVPLASFSDTEVQQLRMVHVLNGAEVRSFAADFIRRV